MKLPAHPTPMAACPRFERCNAPLCPLDPDWRSRSMVQGEAVCGLLLEGVKAGGEARLRGATTREVAEAVLGATPDMISTVGYIRRAAAKASQSGSRLEQVARLSRHRNALACTT
jgi:hypothetical protein